MDDYSDKLNNKKSTMSFSKSDLYDRSKVNK